MTGTNPKRLTNLKIIIAVFVLIEIFSMTGCKKGEMVHMAGSEKISKAEQARQLIDQRVLIILSREPDLKSNILDIQDYIMNGKSFVPFFSSKACFDESTQGALSGKPIFEIDRLMFFSVCRPHDMYILNPRLKSEMIFTGEELKSIFPEPFHIK